MAMVRIPPAMRRGVRFVPMELELGLYPVLTLRIFPLLNIELSGVKVRENLI